MLEDKPSVSPGVLIASAVSLVGAAFAFSLATSLLKEKDDKNEPVGDGLRPKILEYRKAALEELNREPNK